MKKIAPKNSFQHQTFVKITPEKALLIEILRRAINDFVWHCGLKRSDAKTHEIQRSARLWLFGPERHPLTPFSFHWICQHLDQCPRTIRKRVLCLAKTLKKEKHSLSKPLTCKRVDLHEHFK